MNKQSETERILSPSAAEGLLTVAKVAAGVAVAAAGGPPGTDGVAVALIDSVMRPLMGKRYASFANSVIERLEKLELDFEKVAADNEHFTTIYLQAAREAVATHETEKIEALRNAVVNTAKGTQSEKAADEQLAYLALAGQLSVAHIRILRFACVRDKASVLSVESATKALYPSRDDVVENTVFVAGLFSDLVSRGLIAKDSKQGAPKHSYSLTLTAAWLIEYLT